MVKVAFWTNYRKTNMELPLRYIVNHYKQYDKDMVCTNLFIIYLKNESCILIWNGEKCEMATGTTFCDLVEMTRNAIRSDFQSSKMTTHDHCKIIKMAYWYGEKCNQMHQQ